MFVSDRIYLKILDNNGVQIINEKFSSTHKTFDETIKKNTSLGNIIILAIQNDCVPKFSDYATKIFKSMGSNLINTTKVKSHFWSFIGKVGNKTCKE